MPELPPVSTGIEPSRTPVSPSCTHPYRGFSAGSLGSGWAHCAATGCPKHRAGICCPATIPKLPILAPYRAGDRRGYRQNVAAVRCVPPRCVSPRCAGPSRPTLQWPAIGSGPVSLCSLMLLAPVHIGLGVVTTRLPSSCVRTVARAHRLHARRGLSAGGLGAATGIAFSPSARGLGSLSFRLVPLRATYARRAVGREVCKSGKLLPDKPGHSS